MRSYFYYSCALHGLLLAAFVVVGTILAKPKMGYYAVDLMSSLPAGGGTGSGVESAPQAPQMKAAVPVPKAPAPKKAPVVAPAPSRPSEDDLPDQDTIRMLAKLKKKRLAQPRPYAETSTSDPSGDSAASGAAPANSGRGGMGMPGGGSGLVAEAAGTPFPFPWYLKAIADKLDKNWKPPQEFDPDTVCQVTFVIDRSGQISGSKLTRTSRDALFDQLALRAVEYSNPMPPLPNGFPDEMLKVHMKFVGKRY